MLFYTDNGDADDPSASIHNSDTGITYRLEVVPFSGEPTPVVVMFAPNGAERRLFRGDQAVEFWRALLFRNPSRASSVRPYDFLDRLPGAQPAETTHKDDDIPF